MSNENIITANPVDITSCQADGDSTITVNGEGTIQINMSFDDGDKTIKYGNDIESCRIEINYDIPSNYIEDTDNHDMEICYGKNGNDLKIYCIDWMMEGSNIVDTITIENYYSNPNINKNLYFNDLTFDEYENPYRELIQFSPSNVECKTYYVEANNDENVFDTSEIESRVIYCGGNGYDTVYAKSDKTIGDEFYTGDSGVKKIYSGSGDDTIVIENFSDTDVTINDSNGANTDPLYEYDASTNDELYLETKTKGDGAFIFFDVATKEYDQPQEGYSPNLYIAKNSNIMNFMEDDDFPGFVSIENWFNGRNTGDGNISNGAGYIERIYFNGNEISVEDYIIRVTEEVQNVLEQINDTRKTNFKSVIEALEGLMSNPSVYSNEIQAILNCYTKENALITLNENYENSTITFNGSNGNDVIKVDSDYIVNAGAGDDKIFRVNSESTASYELYGEAGNDILEAGKDVKINGGTGNNIIIIDDTVDSLNKCDAKIYHGNGNDYLHFSNVSSVEDLNFARKGQDLVITVPSTEQVVALKDYYNYNSNFSVKNLSFGSLGNIKDSNSENYLYANQLFAKVQQQATSLTTVLESLPAMYTGTTGNDSLMGTAKNNIFIFEKNSGHDTILQGKGQDTLRFVDIYNNEIPEGIPEDTPDFAYYASKNDLIISYNFGRSSVTIKNYLLNPAMSSVKYIEFVDKNGESHKAPFREELSETIIKGDVYKKNNLKGTILDDEITGGYLDDTIKAGKGNDEITGGAGNDKLYGEDGEDTFYFAENDGHDIIYSSNGADTIQFFNNDDTSKKEIKLSDLSLSVNKNDLIINYSENGSIRLANYLTKGSSVNDIIGYDWDTTVENLVATKPIIINGLNGKKNNLKGTALIDEIHGGDKDDTIKAGVGNDIIYGGAGNDKLYGEAGEDKFYFNSNDGYDVIYSGKDNDEDKIFLKENLVDNISISVNKNDLVINYSENGSVALANYFKTGSNVKTIEDFNGGSISIESLIANNPIVIKGLNGKKNNLKGTALIDEIHGGDKDDTIKADAGNDMIYGGAGDDKLYGGAGVNRFYTSANDGNDVVYYDKNANDVIDFTDVSLEQLHIEKGKYNGIKIVTENGNSVELANYLKNGLTSVGNIYTGVDRLTTSLSDFLEGKRLLQQGDYKNNSIKGTTWNDEISGYEGNDTIRGGKGDDYIIGGRGDDKLYGEAGSDRFIFVQDDGKDVIYLDKSTEADIIELQGISKETLSYSRKNNDLVIYYGNVMNIIDGEISMQTGLQEDSITISNYFRTQNPTINAIECSDGTVYLSELGSSLFVQDVDFYADENYEEKIGSGKFYKDMVGANNLYYSTGKFAGIEAGVGNDCIQNNSSFLYANGGDGNDIYTTSLNRVTHVFDSSGKDIVKFSESKNDINFLFQVKIDNEGNIVNDSDYDGLFVINNASFRTFKNTKNLDLIKNYLDCQGYFDTDDNIEVFQAKDGYLTRNDLNTLRQNVATWLEDNGYHSSLEAMMDVDNITAAEELLAIYQNLEWNSFQV